MRYAKINFRMNQEFQVGDIVTFKAYEKAIKAKVKEVSYGNGFNDADTTPKYHLTGIDDALFSQCSGFSIVESMYYREYKKSEGDLKEYLCKFSGRFKNGFGMAYNIETVVDAFNEEHAENMLYANFEHIKIHSINEV